MIVNYNFANGETTKIEVTDEWAKIIFDMDRLESNNDRKQRYHCYSLDYGTEMGCQYEGPSNIEELFSEPTMEEKLHLALPKLKESHRQILIQYYFHHISQDELAEMYGVSQQAISKKLAAAEKNLKKFL